MNNDRIMKNNCEVEGAKLKEHILLNGKNQPIACKNRPSDIFSQKGNL